MRLPLLPLLLAATASPCFAQTAPAAPPAAAAAAPAPVDPERLAIAEEVVAAAFPVERRTAMLMGVATSMDAQMRPAMLTALGADADAGLEAILQRFLDRIHAQSERTISEASPPIFTALARAYARAFTRDELVQIRAFVATPAGAKYLRRSTEMLADPDVARANTAYFERVIKDVQPLQAEFFREVAAYAAAHPRQKKP